MVKSVGAAPAPRRHFGSVQPLGTVADVFYWEGDMNTLYRGAAERVMGVVKGGQLLPVPLPTHSIMTACAKFTRRFLRIMPTCAPGSRVDFVSTYSGPKQVGYEKSRRTLEVFPLQLRDHKQNMFPKCEKTDKSPRIIICDTRRRNIELGKFLKLNEHRFFSAMNRLFGYRVVMKGRTVEERARAIIAARDSITDPVFLMLDFSKYDVHHGTAALEYEHMIYNTVFRNDAELRELLRFQLVTRATGYCRDGVVKLVKRGMRTSGCMNTSLGNVVVVCAMLWSYMAEQGVAYRLINDGDDSVLCVSRRDVTRIEQTIQAWHLRLGFDLRIDGKADMPEGVRFCQSAPINLGGHWTMVRDPFRAISRDYTSTNIVDRVTAQAHCAAVGMCGGYLSRGVPVMQAFYECGRRLGSGREKRILRATRQLRGSGLYYHSKRADKAEKLIVPILDVTRCSFWLAFGVTPQEQLALEGALANVTQLGQIEDRRQTKYSTFDRPILAFPLNPFALILRHGETVAAQSKTTSAQTRKPTTSSEQAGALHQ